VSPVARVLFRTCAKAAGRSGRDQQGASTGLLVARRAGSWRAIRTTPPCSGRSLRDFPLSSILCLFVARTLVQEHCRSPRLLRIIMIVIWGPIRWAFCHFDLRPCFYLPSRQDQSVLALRHTLPKLFPFPWTRLAEKSERRERERKKGWKGKERQRKKGAIPVRSVIALFRFCLETVYVSHHRAILASVAFHSLFIPLPSPAQGRR
jgi:hypothetical protein